MYVIIFVTWRSILKLKYAGNGGTKMRKKLMVLLSAAMLFNSIAGLAGYAETNETDNAVVENENIITETGTRTIGGTESHPMCLADDKTTAEQVAAPFVAESVSCTYSSETFGNGDFFCGCDSRTGSVTLKDPNGAYYTGLVFYAYYRNSLSTDDFEVSVSDTLAGEYTPVTEISKERVARLNNTGTHSVWKFTVTGFQGKYVKLQYPNIGQRILIGAITYDWLKITDLSLLPDGTNKFCGENNPYWLSDDTKDIFKPFVEYSASANATKADNAVTDEDLAANKSLVGNPVNTGDVCFIGVNGNYVIMGAPENAFLRRFKYYIYAVGDQTKLIKESLSVSNEINGIYEPVEVIVKRLGSLAGKASNHLLFEVETAEMINCKYAKITIPSGGWPKLGAIEYDYKINKVGMAIDKVFYSLNDILDGQNKMHVDRDLNLFETIEVDGKSYNIEWKSNDPERLKPDGTVTQFKDSKTISVTAKVKDALGSDVYSKDYEITVAALGSTLVMDEDFEAAEIDETTGMAAVTGYNGWTATNTECTQMSIIYDPSSNLNKVLRANRDAEGGSGDRNTRTYEKISSGKVELSFKHMTNVAKASEFRLGFAGLDLYVGPNGVWGYGGGSRLSLTPQEKVTWKMGVWHEYRFVLDMDKYMLDIFFDGKKVLDGAVLNSATYSASDVSLATKNNRPGPSYFDDICVRNLSPEISEAIETDAQLLDLPQTTTDDIDLVNKGMFDTMIAWESSDENVISDNGIVTQQEEDTDVTLRATLVKGEYKTERNFVIKVLGSANTGTLTCNVDALEKIADRFSLSEMLGEQSALNITDNITLPTQYNAGDAGRLGGCTIKWTGDGIISDTGVVTRGEKDKKATLTAEFSFVENSDVKVERTYTLLVSGEGDNAYINRMDGDVGDDIPDITVNAGEGSNAFYGTWQAPDDRLNGVIGVSRSAKSDVDSGMVVKTDFTGRSADVGMSFYLLEPSGKITVNIDGVGVSVIIENKTITVNGMRYNAEVGVKKWHKIALSFDDYNKIFYVYLDGEMLVDRKFVYEKDFTVDSITVKNNKSNGSIGTWYIDDIYIRDTTVSDDTAIQRTIDAIDIEDVAEWNIELPTNGKHGALISWSSEDDSVLDGNGIVKRTVGGDRTITLTAIVSRGESSDEADFDVLVPGLRGDETPTQEKFTEHVNAIDISELAVGKHIQITDDLDLFSEYMKGNCAFYGGMDVEWSSELPNIISDAGEVTQPMFDKGVTLTATFKSKRAPAITAQKDFTFIVLAKGETIFYEDFDDISEDDIGNNIDGFREQWTFEKQLEENKGMKAEFAIDPADIEKKFEEANKTFRISRYVSPSDFPERARWVPSGLQKKAIVEADAIIFSFNIKFVNPDSKIDYTFGGVKGQIKRDGIRSTIQSTYKDGPLNVEQWYTMTWVICPKNKVVYFLIDGKIATLSPYYTAPDRLDVAYLEMHTFRNDGLSDVYFDDFSIRALKDSDSDAVANAAVQLYVPQNVTDQIELPSFGADRAGVTWTSDNHGAVLDNGKIVGNGSALLTAIIKRGTEVTTKEFVVNATKTDDTGFAVNSLTVSDGIISGANVSYPGGPVDAELIVLVYDKGRLVQIRNTAVTGTNITFDAIDTTVMYDCEVKAYIKKKSELLSNVLVTDLQ